MARPNGVTSDERITTLRLPWMSAYRVIKALPIAKLIKLMVPIRPILIGSSHTRFKSVMKFWKVVGLK